MSPGAAAAELLLSPAADVPAVSAACRARLIEREGVPMFVALHDARPGTALRVGDGLSVAEGARLAALFDHYERGLAVEPTDPVLEAAGVEGAVQGASDPELDPTGGAAALIDVLVVLSDQHLRARPELPS